MRCRARRQGATATSRVGQEWGRRGGLRWLSAAVRMSTGQLGMPEEEGLRRPLLPHSIVVVLDVVGSNPIVHPIEGCPDQGFSVMTSGSQTCEKALSGARRCHADPVEGPLSCGYGHGRVGQNCARRPRTCAARALSNDNKADARRPRSGGHARDRRTGHCRTRLEPLLPSWSASTAASNGMQPASSTTSCRQRSRRITLNTRVIFTAYRPGRPLAGSLSR